MDLADVVERRMSELDGKVCLVSGGAGHIRVALTVESELLKEASIRIRRLADTCLAERK